MNFSSQPLEETFFDASLSLMKEFWWLLDFKWTDTLVSDVLERIPSDWVEFIANLSANEVRDLLTDHLVEDTALPEELFKFVVRCRELSLRSSWSSVYSSNSSSRSRTNKKISEKKRVEIEHVQKLVLDVVTDQLRLSSSDVTVLDLGAGLGYISEALHNSGFNVIGIECNEKLCITANDRYADKNIRFVPLKIDESNECLGSVTELVRDRNNVIVLGLHCCGDLLNNALEMFSKVDQIKAAICVTCCYHLITIPKFPRSETLKTLSRELDVAFNSTVLRVGTYDPPLRWCRDLNQEKLDTHTKTSFYRAVFERFLKQPNVTWSRPVKKKIGSVLNGTFSEFIESVELGFRSDSDVDISVELHKIYDDQEHLKKRLNPLKHLQTMIQPVVESLIVLDHVVRLRELGYSATTVQCFDQLTSPRNLSIIALKSKT